MNAQTPRPSRLLVRRIIGEEAMRANVPADAVINIERRARASAFKAMRRIAADTNCTPRAIADVWGCDAATVITALSAPELAAPIVARPAAMTWAKYDARTIERLRWAHGEARTAQILAGQDPRTQSDIAKWNTIGGSRGA